MDDRVVTRETTDLNFVPNVFLPARTGCTTQNGECGELVALHAFGNGLQWNGKWWRETLRKVGKGTRLVGGVIMLFDGMLRSQ